MDDESLTRATFLPFFARCVACFALAVFPASDRVDDVRGEDVVVVLNADAHSLKFSIDFASDASRRTMTNPKMLQNALDDAIAAYCASKCAKVCLRVPAAAGFDVEYIRSSDGTWCHRALPALARPQRASNAIDGDFDDVAFAKCAFVDVDCAMTMGDAAEPRLEEHLEEHLEFAMGGLNCAIARHRAHAYVSKSKKWFRGFALGRQRAVLAVLPRRGGADDDDDDDDGEGRWVAAVNATLATKRECRSDPEPTLGAIEVWINGSMLSRKEARVILAHVWTLDDKLWSAFHLAPARFDERRDEPNVSHAVFFKNDCSPTSAAASGEMVLKNMAIHFMSLIASPEDALNSTMVLSQADGAKWGATLLNPLPATTSAALINSGIFDALRVFKSDYDASLATDDEMRVYDAAVKSAEAALACLREPATEATRLFLAENARLGGPDWETHLLQKVGHIAAFRENDRACEQILRIL